jgi:hypothetical protein
VFWGRVGASLLPVTRRTGRRAGSPGHPPPLQVEAGVDGRRAVLRLPGWRRVACLPHQVGAYNTQALIGALGKLGGQKATLLWNGLPAHAAWRWLPGLAAQRSWYAPELNPVEALWSSLKGGGAGQPGT